MRLKILIGSFLMMLSGGCTVIGVGAVSAIGGTYYLSGEIKASYPVSIYHLYEVSLYTFQEEGMKVLSKKNTKADADIQAQYHDETEVKVHIYYNKKGLATLGIRVGAIGDEKRSRELLKKMERYI